MTSSASWPVSAMTSATVRLSQRRFSGRRKAPSRTSAQPAGLAYERAAGRELGTDAVARGAVGETLLERPGSAGLDPLRQLDEQPRRGPLGRIGVERDVEPLGAGVVDQREHRLGRAGVRLAVVEVGDVGRRAGAPADLDRLAERVEIAVAERIADVRVVEATVAPGLGGQRGELLGRGERARRIVEPGATARTRPRPSRRAGVRASCRGRARRRARRPSRAPRSGARELPMSVADVEADRPVVARQVAPDRRPVVVDRGAAVEAGVELDERLEVLASRERGEAVAVDADELGRHALADLGLVAAVGQDHQAAVAVEVDEPGRDDLPGRVDRPADVRRRRRLRCRGAGSGRRSTATVPGRPGAPVPSTMVPPTISRSAWSVIARRARSSARGPGQSAAADPGRADHVGMRPEDEPRGEIGRVVVGRLAGRAARRTPGRRR